MAEKVEHLKNGLSIKTSEKHNYTRFEKGDMEKGLGDKLPHHKEHHSKKHHKKEK